MLRADQPRWIDAEWEFGFDDEVRGAARLELPSGEVFLRGAVDRVDELEDNKLRIVDYKTGGTYDYRDGTGTYNGGRRLQHALYTAAIEQHLQRRVEVAEYHCPTVKGEGSRFDYARERLSRWPEILENLFDLIGDGLFLAPPDKEAPCKFCDYRAICRVSERFGKLISPPVEWARNNAPLLEQFEPLLRVRRIDE
jgi:ATP-dependent helicase/nuclease subunit B